MASTRTKYDLMAESVVKDYNGNSYPDLATFPIEDFKVNTKPAVYTLTWADTERFFDLTYEWYGSFDFYDDVILWLNDIRHISDSEENFEKKINMFSKQDIDNWYTTYAR